MNRPIYREGFFKVSRRILKSSLWYEPGDVVKVFLTLLSLSQEPAGPRNGVVLVARRQLAAQCFLSEDVLDACIEKLSSPDPQSRTSMDGGRRIEVLQNGFRVLNYGLYHDEAKDSLLREARAKAGEIGGKRSGQVRRAQSDKSRSKPEANPKQNEATETETETETTDYVLRTPSAPPSWSAQACDDWIAQYGGTAPGGEIGKALKPLVVKHGWETVRPAWKRYLSETEAEYVSASRFGSTFGHWAGTSNGPARKQTAGQASMAAAARFVARHKGGQ